MALGRDWRAGLRPGLYIGAALAVFLLLKSPAFPETTAFELIAYVVLCLTIPIALFVGLYAIGILRPRQPPDK